MSESLLPVKIEYHVSVPVRDGTLLSVQLIRPDREGRFPVLIEYQPYRKDDAGIGGISWHRYLAERGFVGVRLDVRGTGSSEGINTDEYMPVEQQDGYDVVEWCAKQPWSNGHVGMYGASYGGFTAIQVAMHRPPHLKAIAPMYATDDRYTDDCHYTPGGNMRMYYDVGAYGGTMVSMNALPPIPEFVGERWASMWKERLDQNFPYLITWLKNQVDGEYWRGASLRPGYDRILCPVMLIGGWRDGYANPMLRIFPHLRVPKQLLMGPWVHTRPHASVPGPRINYLHEMERFFGRWLRQDKNGLETEAPVTVYMQEPAKAERTLDITPGHWRRDANFPPAGAQVLTYHLQEGGRLEAEPAGKPTALWDEFQYLPTVGLSNGYWSGGMIPYYLAEDQRKDEAHSLVYTTPPFKQTTHLLGWPRVILHASATAPVATFVAKLSDVAPDGTSVLIVDGSLNGTRRDSKTNPKPLTPGEIYPLEIPMNPTGWVLHPGHRLRLAVSGSDFPNLWPTPLPSTHRVYRGGEYSSRVLLPVVPASELPPPAFLPPPQLVPVGQSFSQPASMEVLQDQLTGIATVSCISKGGHLLPENRGTVNVEHRFTCSASAKDPAQASITGVHAFELKREDGTFNVSSESSIRATATDFHLAIDLQVLRNGRPFFQKHWLVSEPRRLL